MQRLCNDDDNAKTIMPLTIKKPVTMQTPVCQSQSQSQHQYANANALLRACLFRSLETCPSRTHFIVVQTYFILTCLPLLFGYINSTHDHSQISLLGRKNIFKK
jgi:hypothetical protein